jgi:hypothetical protein
LCDDYRVRHRGNTVLWTLGSSAWIGGCAPPGPRSLEGAGARGDEDHDDEDAESNSASSRAPDSPSSSDAGVRSAGCAAQDLSWADVGASCTAPSGGVLAEGDTRTITDSTPDGTGSLVITCTSGRLVLSAQKCSVPTELAVGNAGGCANGFCSAVTSGQCGVPDPTKAKAICETKGFRDASTFAVMPGPVGAQQCSPDGSGCFVNANADCNIVFSSVTCVR